MSSQPRPEDTHAHKKMGSLGIIHRPSRTGAHGCRLNYPVVTGSPKANCFFRDCDAPKSESAGRGWWFPRAIDEQSLSPYGWMSSRAPFRQVVSLHGLSEFLQQ
ncbi:hypothetical protein PoB_004445400 [Plakobranchus ocellatus]|uniref:Uncharacterized protein n=1 Tax=Plakobranchus ocellatus TaxID=259542 RepID=A0AAV4BGG2_9GAST|nr:hypothetical protein PoB_004445400 [Plakobranchus ocellatus]